MPEASQFELEMWSWRREAARLLRVEKPSSRWLKACSMVLALTASTIALCLGLGIWFDDDASHHFGERKLGTLASAALLTAAAVVCFRIRKRHLESPLQRFWLWWGVLICITAADDLFRLHEVIDRRFHQVFGLDPNHHITDHLDDLLVASYLIPSAYLWFRYRRNLIRLRLMVQSLALGFLAFLAMTVMDFTMENKAIEDSVKLAAEALILCSMLAAYYETAPGEDPATRVDEAASPVERSAPGAG